MEPLNIALSRVATARPTSPPAVAERSPAVASSKALENALALVRTAPSSALAAALSDAAAWEERPETDAQAQVRLGRAETAEERQLRLEASFVIRRKVPAVPAEILLEVERRMAALRQALQTAPIEMVEEWLLSLAAISERAPKGEALDNAVEAISGVLDLPACCYSAETLRAVARACRRYGTFPGYAKIDYVLQPHRHAALAELRRLERIAATTGRGGAPRAVPTAHPARTQEEIEAVRSASAALRAELIKRGGDEPPLGRSVRPPPKVPTLAERLGRLEEEITRAQALLAESGVGGQTAAERSMIMERTAAKWRAALPMEGHSRLRTKPSDLSQARNGAGEGCQGKV